MPDFNVRADAVNVEQIMEQIRGRIREKRGVDYTEQQIQEMAQVKLEKFLDPRGVRSDLLQQFRRAQPPYEPPNLPNYAFEDTTLFESHRGGLRLIRKLLNPLLKLFFNPNPLIQALNIQSRLNTMHAEREARNEAARHTFDTLHYEVLHNLVVETTRMSIEVKNLKMKVESLTSRLEFNERRARALESVVVYKPEEPADAPIRPPLPPPRERDARDRGERRDARDQSRESSREQRPPRELPERSPVDATPAAPGPEATAAAAASPTPAGQEGPGQRSRRRRRRRGRRGGGAAAGIMGEANTAGDSPDDTPSNRAEGGEHFDERQADTSDTGTEGSVDAGPAEPGTADPEQ